MRYLFIIILLSVLVGCGGGYTDKTLNNYYYLDHQLLQKYIPYRDSLSINATLSNHGVVNASDTNNRIYLTFDIINMSSVPLYTRWRDLSVGLYTSNGNENVGLRFGDINGEMDAKLIGVGINNCDSCIILINPYDSMNYKDSINVLKYFKHLFNIYNGCDLTGGDYWVQVCYRNRILYVPGDIDTGKDHGSRDKCFNWVGTVCSRKLWFRLQAE